METKDKALEKAHSAIARERVATDLRMLSRDAEDLLKATAGDVSEKAKAARERLKTVLERAKLTCANLQEQTVAVAKRADAVVRNHPYESVGVAFGLGLLVGVLAMRK